MMKRLVSLVLCLAMLAGTLLMVGCGEAAAPSSDETLPATINMLLIADSVTPEAAQNVEDAINKLTKARFKTKVEMTFVTADEYIELVEERTAEAEYNATKLAAINKYNSLAQKEANAAEKLLASEKKNTSKWTQKVSSVVASTLSTGEIYSAEETTVYEDGKIETLYPEATSPIDIIMIADREMYDYLDEKGYLLSIANKLTTDFPKFQQYIYPTFFNQLKTITGDIKAIPNNNVLAQYTYLVVDKALADKYDLDVDLVDNYAELSGFLASVKANESVAPMATEPDALGVYTYFEDGVAVGTYADPIYGFSITEGTSFDIQNLFDIPEYKAHLALMQEYKANGYIVEGAEDFAVNVVKGDASVVEEYADDCYLKVVQNPFVSADEIFNGMMAVSSYSSDEKRALQIIELFTTDSEAKNLLQYGIEYDGENDDIANYEVIEVEKEDGSVALAIERLNNDYMMNNAYTGNVYMGYPEEGQNVDAWTYYKQTNLDSALAPFSYFYVDTADLDGMLEDIIRRAVLTEALAEVGIDYDEYENSVGTTNGDNLRENFKQHYISYFMEFLAKEGTTETQLVAATKKQPTAAAADFLNFILSAEGQACLKEVGYLAVDENAPAYTAGNVSGTVTLAAYAGAEGVMARVPYIDALAAKLAAAYAKVQPNVTIVLPKKDSKMSYTSTVAEVTSGKADMILVSRELTAAEEASVAGSLIAKDIFTVFDNNGHLTYNVSWYEDKMIEDYTTEKYGDVIAAEDLAVLVHEKLATLAGAKASKNSTAGGVYDNAKKSASDYYKNIEYLRIMSEILLWDELSEAELEQYRNLKDVDFETAVFNYVRANYETENNLTEEGYVELVQNFMASVLEYSAADRTTYTISWAEFQEAKENAMIYLNAATAIQAQYQTKLEKAVGKGMLSLLSLSEVMDEVYNIMYEEYLTENGLDKETFENSVKDIYLSEVGTSAEVFAEYSKTSDEYKNYVGDLRKEYKSILVDVYGNDAYKAGIDGISNEDVLNTLFAHFLEETTHLNDEMAAIAGVDYKDFEAAEVHMNNYEMYLNTMKTKFVYTLRTKYTSSQINNWSFEEAENNIYNILYETGFYTNEMAKYIGLSLSDYMLAKSNAVTYQNYLTKVTNALSSEIGARGYNVADFAKEDGDMIEEVCAEIILEKYYGNMISIEEKLYASCNALVAGIETAADATSYMESASAELADDYFLNAVIDTLQAAWEEEKAALEVAG